MEVVFFLLLVVILVLVVTLKNGLDSKIIILQQKIDSLANELKKARMPEEPAKPVEKKRVVEEPLISHATPPVIPVIKEKEKETIKPEKPEEKVTVPMERIEFPKVVVPPSPTLQQPKPAFIPPPKPHKPGFFERNPDLEKFIGENLANKIGIGILVLGIGFFVKYAIDQEWIGEIGRVFIGIACGGILIGVAHRLRKTFIAFSSVLVGGGIAVLYLTIAIAFHEYGIFTQTAAFLLMVVITGFTIVLSLGYDRVELAILAILGGFASPFMVSTGEGNYVVLFTYVLVLDVGMLVLAYYKKWNLVNIIAYVFTLILFGSWLTAKFDGEDTSMIRGALIFATLFYLVFFAMNIVNNIRRQMPFKAIEISLLLSNAFCYYAAGMMILNNAVGEDFKGLFTAVLGIFNFIFAFTLYKNSKVDRNLVFLLIGLVLTFISLAAPVQLEGNYITLFWAAEAVLLLWLSQKSGIRLMKLASVIIMVLMVFSLVMDWEQLYFVSDAQSSLPVILNKAYITGVCVLVSIGLTLHFLKFETEPAENVGVYKVVLSMAGIVILYTANFLELQHQLYEYGMTETAAVIVIGLYNMFFVTCLLVAEKKLLLPEPVRIGFAFWGVVAILSYLVFYHYEIIEARNNYLLGASTGTGFWFHYGYLIFLIVVSILSLQRMQKLTSFNTATYNLYSWFYIFFFVFVASAELDHVVLTLAFAGEDTMDHILTQNHKIGFPILWGLASFILIAVGLKTKKKHLRVISLTLLLITLLKLFFVDIRGISEGGKIAAFISLGVLLLVVSFMYQRLKKLLLADESATSIPEKENPA